MPAQAVALKCGYYYNVKSNILVTMLRVVMQLAALRAGSVRTILNLNESARSAGLHSNAKHWNENDTFLT